MNVKHTPGPWMVPHFANDDVGCGCASVLAEQYMGAVAEVFIKVDLPLGEGGNDCPPLEEAKANARLIAAAPELLAALVALDEAFCSNNDTRQERHQSRLALIAARAAIAKATGEPA